jgi:hypothetical protein
MLRREPGTAPLRTTATSTWPWPRSSHLRSSQSSALHHGARPPPPHRRHPPEAGDTRRGGHVRAGLRPAEHTARRATADRSTPHTYDQPPPTPTAPRPGSGQASSVASANGPLAVTKRLMPAEIVQRRKDGKCFHCDDFFSNGHKTVYK